MLKMFVMGRENNCQEKEKKGLTVLFKETCMRVIRNNSDKLSTVPILDDNDDYV